MPSKVLFNFYIKKIFSVIYEGEFLNGLRHGKGQEFYECYENNKIEVEYFEGKRNGKYKVTNIEGEIIMEGEYLNGKKTGKWKEIYDNGLIFEGEYLNNMRNGKGKEYYENGLVEFEGEYKDGKRCCDENMEFNEEDYYDYEYDE